MQSSKGTPWSPVLQNSLNFSKDDMLLMIGHSLQAWSDHILQEDVPARFNTLIERLENSKSGSMQDRRG
jgi:hypothetical protein